MERGSLPNPTFCAGGPGRGNLSRGAGYMQTLVLGSGWHELLPQPSGWSRSGFSHPESVVVLYTGTAKLKMHLAGTLNGMVDGVQNSHLGQPVPCGPG